MNPQNRAAVKPLTPVSINLLILGILAFVAHGCRPSEESANWTATQADLIRQAGQRLGVPVRTERMAHFAQSGASWFGAPAANLESIPATDLPHGVNVSVAYFDLPEQKFPKGFYAMRAFADVKQVGRVEGKGQLINDKGEVVCDLPATVEVKSMTVPDGAATRLTPVTICTGAACHIGDGSGTPPVVGFWVCYACSNGYIVCFRFSYVPSWFWD